MDGENSSGWNWEKVISNYWTQPDEEVCKLIKQLADSKHKTALDIGAGKGRHSIYMSQMGYKVDAIDNSLSSIQILHTNNNKLNPYNVIFCDMHDLSKLNKKYDIIIAVNSIYHTDKNGIKRIINGIDQCMNYNAWGYVTFLSVFDKNYKGKPVQKKKEETGQWINHLFVNEDDVRELLSQFQIVQLKTIKYGNKDNPSVHYGVLFTKAKKG